MNTTEINEIKVNGIDYIRKDSVSKIEYSGDIKIVILQRGWIYIGRLERNGNDCKLHNASNIRTWGTSRGLPELVHGPTSKTVLDKCDGVVEFDWLTVVHTVTVNQEKWKNL